MVDPGRAISYFATKKHGLRDGDVKGARAFAEISHEIAAAVEGRVCVAHDAIGDLLMLGEGDVRTLDLPSRIFCTYRMAKAAIARGQPVSPGVVSLSEWLGIGEPPETLQRRTVHSSSLDAWRTGQIFLALALQLAGNVPADRQEIDRFCIGQKSLQSVKAKLAKRRSKAV